nr:sialidase L, SL {fragment T20} [Macrobdella decora=leeches, Peptide Partial, 19 aa] [Macrobdella decora]
YSDDEGASWSDLDIVSFSK